MEEGKEENIIQHLKRAVEQERRRAIEAEAKAKILEVECKLKRIRHENEGQRSKAESCKKEASCRLRGRQDQCKSCCTRIKQ